MTAYLQLCHRCGHWTFCITQATTAVNDLVGVPNCSNRPRAPKPCQAARQRETEDLRSISTNGASEFWQLEVLVEAVAVAMSLCAGVERYQAVFAVDNDCVVGAHCMLNTVVLA